MIIGIFCLEFGDEQGLTAGPFLFNNNNNYNNNMLLFFLWLKQFTTYFQKKQKQNTIFVFFIKLLYKFYIKDNIKKLTKKIYKNKQQHKNKTLVTFENNKG